MERDVQSKFYDSKVTYISTHTLTWSVTVQKEHTAPRPQISTHTLTWSVTEQTIMSDDFLDISTHTLTWSVTG